MGQKGSGWLAVLLQRQLLPVPEAKGMVRYPVAQVQIAAVPYLQIEWQMPVSENKVIVMLCALNFFYVLYQPFPVFAQELLIGFVIGITAAVGKELCQTYAIIGMKLPETELEKGICEYFFNELIAMIARAKSIAMTDVERFTVPFAHNGLPVYLHAQLLLQVTEHPHIMIAGEHMHRFSAIAQIGQGAQQTGVALGYYLFVLEPEIEYISHQKYLIGLSRILVQPAYEKLFALQRFFMVGNTQVQIGGKYNQWCKNVFKDKK